MNSNNFEIKNNSQQSSLHLWDYLRKYSILFMLLVVIHLLLLAYYWFEWHTFTGFVRAIDQGSDFMQDFVFHYYPMSKQILQVPTPVPGYFYTSFFALVLAPLGILPLPLAVVVWVVFQFACIGVLCIVSARGLLKVSTSAGMALYVFLFTTCFPILHNFRWGQVSVLITGCVIISFILFNKNKRILAGVFLAFAAAIKYYPSFFIIYFILKRDIRTCLTFGFSIIVFYFALPVSLLGFSNWIAFEKATNFAINNAKWVAHDENSQYIVHVGLRWFVNIFDRAAGVIVTRDLTIAGYVIALSCVVMVVLLQKRVVCEKHGLSMVTIFLAIPFVIKTSWPHYFVYLPVCQAAVFSYCVSSFRTSNFPMKGIIALPVLSMALSSIFLFNLFPDWNIYNSYGMLFFANLLLLFAMYAITTSQLYPLPLKIEIE